jgi:Tfp pilus assembly protein FimV
MFDSSLDIEHVFGHRRGMPPGRIRRRRATVVLAAMVLVLAVPAASRAVGDHRDRPAAYVVRSGDTLWSIAVSVSPGSDPRATVDAIVRANGVDAAHLVPGQQLQLPA